MSTSYSLSGDGLTLVGVRDAGTIATERVILRVSSDVNLIRYLVLNATHGKAKEIRDLNKNVFWFPKRTVESGDYVRVYTRVGINSQHDGTYGGNAAHFHDFFWNRKSPIWGGDASAAVLIEIASWRMVEV